MKKIKKTNSRLQTRNKFQKESLDYSQKWKGNSENLKNQDGYIWMADQIKGTRNIFEIGMGNGYSTLELANRGHFIISIEENINCIKESERLLKENNITTKLVPVSSYRFTKEGYSAERIDFSREVDPSIQVLILHGDFLNSQIDSFLIENKIDTVICWLIGTHQCKALQAGFETIPSAGHYRLKIQNEAYRLSDRILPSKGILHIVDRGESMDNDERLHASILNSHKEQAHCTSMNVGKPEQLKFVTSKDNFSIELEITPPSSGRVPDMRQLALISVLSSKH